MTSFLCFALPQCLTVGFVSKLVAFLNDSWFYDHQIIIFVRGASVVVRLEHSATAPVRDSVTTALGLFVTRESAHSISYIVKSPCTTCVLRPYRFPVSQQ